MSNWYFSTIMHYGWQQNVATGSPWVIYQWSYRACCSLWITCWIFRGESSVWFSICPGIQVHKMQYNSLLLHCWKGNMWWNKSLFHFVDATMIFRSLIYTEIVNRFTKILDVLLKPRTFVLKLCTFLLKLCTFYSRGWNPQALFLWWSWQTTCLLL